jgi:predicted ribosome quality control (RQC) complex YloA/Tae2 family protein
MTSFDIAALVPELDRLIKGTRIDNIYQINPVTLLLKLRRSGQPPLHLLIEAGRRLHLTSYVLKKPQKPPTFCMALRKHLRNGEVMGIRQHEFERIVIIEVGRKEGDFKLISELFGEGNIILVNPENKILQALAYRRMRDRNVSRNEVFQHAPSSGRNPFKLSRQDFREIRELGQLEIVRALTKFLSIGGVYAEEILLRAKVDKKVSCNSLTDEELDRIYDELHQILSIIETGNVEPRIIVDDKGEWIDVTPIPMKKYLHFDQKTYETVNEALDEYYTEISAREGVVEVAKGVERELARYQRILQRQRKALEDLKDQIERNKRIGDIIYMHFNDLKFLLQRIMDEKRDGKSWEQIISTIEEGKEAGRVPDIYFHSMEPQRLILNVSVEGSVFPLNLRRSIQANATKYYTRAKKAEKKLEGAEKALLDTQARIEELQQRIGRVEETRKHPPKRRKKAWYEKFRWFHSSDGFLVIGGRDATTNEILVKKYMEPHDIVFHADILGAPFVLIKTGGETPPEQTMRESAQLAASYSRAWRQMLGAVDVYWVTPEQVSKSPPSGQYLKKGAFMIRGPKNYVRGVRLRIAIGVKMEKERVTVIGGPVEAIANQTNVYVEIVPGNQTSSRLAKQIRQLLAEKAPKVWKKGVSEVPLEEIQSFVPLGRGMISVSKP